MSAGFNQRGFVEGWSEEFARAIEMFSGDKASVVSTPATDSTPNPAAQEGYLWWKQNFEGLGKGFVTWIGAAEAAWSSLGTAMADDAAGAKQIYLELLDQAEQGAATLLSRVVGKQVRCTTGGVQETFSSASSDIWEVRITFSGNELTPLLYVIEPPVIDPSESAAPPQHSANNGAGEQPYGSTIDQLLDLELPLSVVLGRCRMQLQEVLKLTSGSVVELDSTVSDRVEIIVHGKLVARGEVVSVKGNYGVRITEVISRRDRLTMDKTLGGKTG